jgi:hypothetical protein
VELLNKSKILIPSDFISRIVIKMEVEFCVQTFDALIEMRVAVESWTRDLTTIILESCELPDANSFYIEEIDSEVHRENISSP